MTTSTKDMTLQDIFFMAFCGIDEPGHVPSCSGCEHAIKGKGCDHSENPNNKEEANG